MRHVSRRPTRRPSLSRLVRWVTPWRMRAVVRNRPSAMISLIMISIEYPWRFSSGTASHTHRGTSRSPVLGAMRQHDRVPPPVVEPPHRHLRPALHVRPADPVEVGGGEPHQVGVAEEEGLGVAGRHPRLQGVGLGAAVPSRRTTLAPAAAASSAVPSVDPSSTTITSRANRQPRAASTTLATVGASLRAGMTMSMTVGSAACGRQPSLARRNSRVRTHATRAASSS